MATRDTVTPMTLPSLLVLYCTREKRVRGGSGSHAGRKLNHRIHTKIKFSLKLLRQTQKPSVCKTGSAKLRPEEMVIVAAHVENLHGDGRKNERVCVYFTITAAQDISSCSCKELKSQSVISGWLNYHPNHRSPYESPSGARTKISTTRKNREFKLLLAQALPGMCATKHHLRAQLSPSLTFWNKNSSPTSSKQCSRPRRDSNLK